MCITGAGARPVAADSLPTVMLAVAVSRAGAGGARSRISVHVYEGEAAAFAPPGAGGGGGGGAAALRWTACGKFPVRPAPGADGTADSVMSMCWIEDAAGGGLAARNAPALIVGTRARCRAYVSHRQFNRWEAAPEILDVPVSPEHGCACVAWAPGSMDRTTGPASTSVMAAAASGSEVLLLNVGRHEGEDGADENRGGRVVARLRHEEEVEAVAWNVIGSVLATTDAGGATKLWGPNLMSEWEERQTVC